MISGDISSGAAGDIQQATNMARAMVMQWGMSDRLGPRVLADADAIGRIGDQYAVIGRRLDVHDIGTVQLDRFQQAAGIGNPFSSPCTTCTGSPRMAPM